ncbi:unnamed protein product [Trichobilharzia regenti]|nr:unnamed protein product [Trichobilharzia regenti]
MTSAEASAFVIKEATPRLNKFKEYARVELRPPTLTAEVLCWFFIGEMIGRRSFLGYSRVPVVYRPSIATLERETKQS